MKILKNLITRIKEYQERYETKVYHPELNNLLDDILEEFCFSVAAEEVIDELMEMEKKRVEVLKNE